MAALIGLASLAAAESTWPYRRELPSLEAADFFLDEGLYLVLDTCPPSHRWPSARPPT